MRAGILQHQNVVGLDVEIGIVDASGEIGQRGEDHRPALEFEQIGIGGRALEDGAAGREIAEQRDQSAQRLERFVARGDNGAVDPGVGVDVEPLAQRFAGDGQAIEMQQVLDLAHQRAHAAAGKEVFHIAIADRLQVHQHRRGVGQFVELFERDRNAGAAGDRREMDDGVGRAADGEQNAQRVLDRFRRDDFRRASDSLPISLTASAPVSSAARRRSACTAGMAAVPGRAMPSASTMQAMVEAVPITAQVPAVVASLPSISLISLSSIWPARYFAQKRRQSVQAPRRSP